MTKRFSYYTYKGLPMGIYVNSTSYCVFPDASFTSTIDIYWWERLSIRNIYHMCLGQL